ncbi:M81 family metallopeptidase [Paenibacillus sp. J5C_2022]|uniref:M81 family metallopeptidase n=1 Tax=Paenibacillus sp. J5C2022 TaxID=2977129 RepID=UPI0021CFD627|nr:M81 family metallopeptidase [Paenibacillus sp. J5C2022]MCU6712621.1 M81 family metallopeptidase [Paenibacillus sp. J5C2022]
MNDRAIESSSALSAHGDAPRIAVAGILHETNTFAPFATGIDAFRQEWIAGNAAFEARYGGTRTSMGGAIDAAVQHGAALAAGLYAAATPSGMVTAEAAEELMNAVVASVDPEADGLLLIMHGAMVAEGIPDMEGELLGRLRKRLGRQFPIAMTIDLHGNVSEEMAELADLIVGYDTYPHIDMYERAVEAFGLLMRYIERGIRPVRALAHTGMIVVPQAMMTEEGAMKELMDRAFAMEDAPGILNVTVAGGFPYSDVPDAGMTFIVTADGDEALAVRCAEELARLAVSWKDRFQLQALQPLEAVRTALLAEEGPVILAEGSDNVGGGAPADATHTLARLIEASKPALAVICDAEAVRTAAALGIGGVFRGKVGGRMDELHGQPVEVEGKVRTLFDGEYRHIGPYMTGQQAFMGLTAVLACGSLTLVLTEKRVAPWDLGHIDSIGLRAEDFHIILVKSAIAWQAAFGPFARSVIHIDSPGCCSANLSHFRYEQVHRPAYPLDAGEPRIRIASYGYQP